MEHSFDIEIAKQYGVNCAIILKHIYFWVEHNRTNNKHLHDGKYWTYNSVKAFSEQFEYLGEKQIRNSLDILEDEGLIEVGNYNQDGRDKTKWYTVTNKGCELLNAKRADAFAERADGNSQKGEPLPDSKTDITITDIIDTNKDIVNSNSLVNKNNIEKENKKRKSDSNSETIKEIVEYLNEVCGTNYRASADDTIKHINARLKERYTIDDFKKVIDIKHNEWQNTEWEKYLRPKTLFGTKFESYLNQKEKASNKELTAVERVRRGIK